LTSECINHRFSRRSTTNQMPEQVTLN